MHRWVVALASVVVPRDRRAEWRAEWEAELTHRERRQRGRGGVTALSRESLGAIADALLLRIGRWRSLRFLLRNWRVTATAVLSLATAIAAIVVGLACWDALLRRPPAVASVDRFRAVHFRTDNGEFVGISYEDFRTLQRATRTLATVTAYPYTVNGLELEQHGVTQRIVATSVADDYFSALGMQPRLGSLRLPRDGGPNRDAIVISEALWRRLGSDPAIAGSTVRLNQHAATVVGVVPDGFRGMLFVWNPDVWMPFRSSETLIGTPPALVDHRSERWLHLVGRVAGHNSDAAIAAEMNTILAQIAREHPAERHSLAVVTPLQTTPPSERSWMSLLLGTLVASVLLMLIVACANVTNLQLGLALARRYEFGVRAAIGATRSQLVMPQVRESLGLTISAGLLGYMVAGAVLASLSSIRLTVGAAFPSPSLDLRPGLLVTLAIGGVVVLCGGTIGLIVAWRTSREGLVATVNRNRASMQTPRARGRGGLVLVQMTVATLVLIALAVAASSLLRLQHAPLGFTARHLAFIGLDLPRSGIDEHRGPAFYDQLRQRLANVPGVEAVSIADGPPFGNGWGHDAVVRAGSPAPASQASRIRISAVDDAYFSTMGIEMRRGRAFDVRDRPEAPEVVVVNETMARSFWPMADPIGQQLRIVTGNRVVTVVGIAADGKYEEVGEPPEPFMYYAVTQHYRSAPVAIVRTAPAAGPDVSTLATALLQMEPRLTFGGLGLMSLEQLLALPLFFSRAVAVLIAVVALLTLVLAIAGLYSSVYYSVSQRREELALRMALGASPASILTLALRSMAAVAMIGAALGVVSGAALLPLVSSLFFGIQPVELSLTAAVAALAVAVVIATTLAVVWPLTRRLTLSSWA